MSRQTRNALQPPLAFDYNDAQRQLLSARYSYPTFLSVQDTLKLHALWAWKGFIDAFRWDTVARVVSSDPEIRANTLKSLLLNLLSLTSIYTFDLLLHPLTRDHPGWLHRNVGWFYQILWLLPVVGVSFYLNSSWCSLIAKRTFILQHGSRAAHQPPASYNGLLTMLATSAYRGVMVVTSVIVSFSFGALPYIGPLTGFAFMCWVDAYYCFEFIWVAKGLSLSSRVRNLEERWAYYFAFGLPSAVICNCGSGLANAALFALVFPAYIIMAMHASPYPHDPYNPSYSLSSSPPSTSTSVRHPSPFIPIRLPVFAPVIWLNDWIVRILSVGGGSGGVRRPGHARVLSDGTRAERVEEGAGMEMRALDRGEGVGLGAGVGSKVPGTRTRTRMARRAGQGPGAAAGYDKQAPLGDHRPSIPLSTGRRKVD